MADTLVDEALILLDRIDPRLVGWLTPASPRDLRTLSTDAAVDVPPEYLRFFEVMGGNADAIFGDIFEISIAGALQFYRAHYLASSPLTSQRFLYLGTVKVGEPFPHNLFLQAHEPGQLYYGHFEGPRPVVRTDVHPETRNAPYFASLLELIVYQAFRLHRVRQYKHVGHVEVLGGDDAGALDLLLQIATSLGLQDTGLTSVARCIEGPGAAIAVHRRSALSPGTFTANVGAEDARRRSQILEMIRDNLPSVGPYLDSVPCR